MQGRSSPEGRICIAGALPSSAANRLRRVEDPPAPAPGTAMPRTGATGQQARDMAAYPCRPTLASGGRDAHAVRRRRAAARLAGGHDA